MHWCDRRSAVAEFGKALAGRGWKLYGWKEDRSDSMTDYFDPESWDGVAVKDGAVCVVDVSGAYRLGVQTRSGEKITRREQVIDGTCEHCHGEGTEPGLRHWPLARAQSDPEGYHNANEAEKRKSGDLGVALMRHVVSPLAFKDSGPPKCFQCHGSGKVSHVEEVETGDSWPEFQPNPARKKWHVERDGKILASGVGLAKFLDVHNAFYDEDKRSRALQGVAGILDKIDAAAAGRAGAVKVGEPVTEAEWRMNEELGGIEIEFPSNPGPDVTGQLKLMGFRWSRRQGLWWAKCTRPRLTFARQLTGKRAANEDAGLAAGGE